MNMKAAGGRGWPSSTVADRDGRGEHGERRHDSARHSTFVRGNAERGSGAFVLSGDDFPSKTSIF